jgi:para-nitrobenzyl esterase
MAHRLTRTHARACCTLTCISTHLGFLVTDEADALGNGGMHGIGDQIVALEFVRRHIAKFGGDPTRVTIGGQSSGSSAVCTLSVSPLAKGLFHQAVAESGPCIGLWGPLNETYGRAARQRVYTSLDVSSIDELRALPAANITWADPDMNYILWVVVYIHDVPTSFHAYFTSRFPCDVFE